MILRKNKIVSVVLNYGDDFYLNKKISHDQNYVDFVLVFELVDSNCVNNDHTNLSNVYFYKINIDSEKGFEPQIDYIFKTIREVVFSLNFNFDDILCFSKSNEFIDFDSFNMKQISTFSFISINHKKIFWYPNLTDGRYIKGSVIMEVSKLLDDQIYLQGISSIKMESDVLDFRDIKNGWSFFGLEPIKSLINKQKFGFIPLYNNQEIIDKKKISNLKKNGLPIQFDDPITIESLKFLKDSENIPKVFDKNVNKIRKSKNIVINLNQNHNLPDGDCCVINLRCTTDILQHLFYDNEKNEFFVFKPKDTLYPKYDDFYLINESKKAIQIFNPIDTDIVKMKGDLFEINDTWYNLKNSLMSDYIKNPLT